MNKIFVLVILMLPYWAVAQQVKLTIRVHAPSSTTERDSVTVIGNQGVWGFWIYPKSKALKKTEKNVFEEVYSFEKNTNLEFKITRGSYFKEALYDGNGQTAQPIKFQITKDTTIILRPSNWNDAYQRSIVGTVRYHHNSASTFLPSTRNVVVWLPPSYLTNPDKKYPVLYANDGQNLLDHSNRSGNEWRMDEIADSLMKNNIIEEFIIVAIANTKDRWVEYNGTPEGENYLKYIVTELKPFIDKTYRTKSDRNNTAIIGSSMGGLISFYAVYNYPHIFSKAACLSSGFFFDEGRIMAKIKTNLNPLHQTRIYLDCGGKDLDYDFLPSNQHHIV